MSYADFKFLGLNRFPTSLYMWGDNTNGLLGDNRTPSYFSWSKISSGGLHTLAIRSDGTLFAWGRNNKGQVGDNTTIDRSSPIQIGTSSWITVSAGYSHSTAVKGDNTLWAWGGNNYGQLGDSTTVNKSSPVFAPGSAGPTPEAPYSWVNVTSGRDHTVAITVGGYLFAWGLGNSGQTGTKYSPTIVGIDQGGIFSDDLSVWGAGWNTSGFIGNGSTSQVNSPTQIQGPWSKISANRNIRIGIKVDGTLWGMGDNGSGALGDSTTVNKSRQVALASGSWSMITISQGSAVFGIKTDGTLYSWGLNGAANGILGLGDTVSRSSPTQVGTSSWSTVTASLSHAAGITVDGKLFSWGLGTSGQLGDGTLVSKSSPVQIGIGSSWSQVAVSASQIYAIRSDGILFASGVQLGQGLLGSLLIGISSDQLTLTQHNNATWSKIFGTSYYAAAAQKTDGTLWAWGTNFDGQLGDGTTLNRSSPIQVGAGLFTGSWTQISIAENAQAFRTIYNNTVYVWGNNPQNELGISSPRSNPTQISLPAYTAAPIVRSFPVQISSLYSWTNIDAGDRHTHILDSTGKLYALGNNIYGELGDSTTINRSSLVQIGTSSWSTVSSGGTHTAAITSTGSLFTWGLNSSGQLGYNSSYIGDYWTQISEGPTHTLAIRNDGALFAWGRNQLGQLGTSDTVSRSSPVQIGTSSWTSIDAGNSHSVAVRSDGKLFTWGANDWGQLGNNPSDFANIGWSKIISSSTGAHSLAIKNDGTLWAWGLQGSDGRLGDGTTVSKSSPTQVGLLNTWIDVAAGRDHSMGITNDYVLYTWGSSTFGQLGDGTNVAKTSPIVIGTNFKKVFAGLLTSIAIDNNDYAYIWGDNTNGLIPGGQIGVHRSNITLALLNNDTWSSFSVEQHVLGIKTNSTLWAWGLNNAGQLGLGDAVNRSSPVQVNTGLGTSWILVSTGVSYSVGITTSNLLYTWGFNSSGQLGLSDTTNRNSPIQVTGVTATNVITGQAHTLILNPTGNLYTWGLNTSGQLGLNDIVNRSSPVQVGTDLYNSIIASNSRSTVIRSTDNALFTWGLNSSGELGDSSTINQSSPIQIGTILYNQSSPVQIGTINYTSVSAGEGHTLGLGTDGVLYGWGKNDQGQIGGQTNTLGIGWSKVVIGPTHSLGIRFDGRLYTWGANATGQLGDRTTISRSSPVQLGTGTWKDITVGQNATVQFSMAIRTDGKLFAWGNNTLGQLGYMSWRQVSVGTGHSLLLRSDGALYAMGTNTAGQIGDATTVNKSSPVLLGTSSWSFINTGVSTSVAIDSRGRLFTWGLNNVGQLGIATTANRSSPVQVTTGSWSQVAVEDYMLAITTQGSLWSWGNNNNGQLGLGTTVNSKVPKLLDGTTTSYSIAFDGIGDYLTLGGQSNFAFGTGNFTVEMWVYTTTLSAVQILYDTNLSGDAVGTGRFELQISTAGVIQLISGAGVTQTQGGVITVGTWNHIAVTRASTSTRIFLNGIQVNTTFTDANNYTNNTNRPIIGANGFNLSTPTFGYISNLRVVKGQALYTSTFTPSTTPLTTTSQGISTGTVSLLTLQDSTIIDNSGNGFTITSVGTPAVAQFNPFSGITSTSSTSWTRVAAGVHSLAINNTNKLYAWGLNSTGQLGDDTTINKSSPIQIGNSSWTLISASMTGHSLAVDPIGTLYAWGNNIYGELGLNNEYINVSSPTQITSANSFTSISAGYNASMGITTINNINTAYGWGYNNYNQLAILTPFTWRSVGIGSGIQASIGLTYGKLYTWGNNTYGQLGNNTTISRSSPTQVGGYLGSSTYKFTVNSILNTAFIANDNSLFMLGDNTYGQLGQGDTISRSSPVQVGAVGNWSTIAISGTGHVVAIASNGTLFAWGRNDYNELGQNDNVVSNRSSPVIIGGNSDWTKVSAGNNFSVAITATGGMYTWGRNDIGQLGRANPLSYTNIGAGIVSRNDGKLYTWGINNIGQIGNNTGGAVSTYRSAPTQIDSVAFASTSWTSVSGSYNNRAGIKIDGKLFVWGDNRYGQLGVSEGPDVNSSRSQPVQILGSWTQVYVNTDNIFSIRSDNTLWGWGNNNIGQLGINDTVSRSSPVQIGTDVNWSMVVASGTGHVLGLKTTGQLFAWGNNQFNELGQNQRVQISYSSPVQIGSSSWTTIGVGNNNSFAIRSGGGLFGWGRNEYGQIGLLNNIPLSWTTVASGDSYSVAIRSDGKLFSWGRNDKGQLGLGHTVSKSAPTQIAVSTNYNLYSTQFNGSTDYLTLPSNQIQFTMGTGNFTIEMWVYITSRAAVRTIYDTVNGSDSTGTGRFGIQVTTGGVIQIFTLAGTVITSGGILAIETWYHIAYAKNSNSGRLYVNGIQVNTTVTDNNNYVVGTVNRPIIGANGFNLSAPMLGYISNLRVIKGQALYTSNFAPSITPLTTTSQGATAANVSLLTCQNDRFIDNGIANGGVGFILTPGGTGITTTTLTPFQTSVYNYSWTQVSATLSHTVAIRNDGTLWAWGANNSGQLGQIDTANRSAPTQIGSSSWTKVAAGSDNSFATRTDGELFGWGDNTNGILGQSNTTSASSPLVISSGTSWNNISATQHIIATTNLGAMFAWGLNNAGQLGLTNINAAGDTVNRSSPVQVGTSSWNLVTAGSSFSMATLSTGVLFTWGLDNAGQLGGAGNGATTASARISRSSPSQIGASSWSAIASGASWASGISAFRLFTWGLDTTGQLGGSSTVAIMASRSSPVQIGSGGLSWTTVAAGSGGGQSITVTGTLWNWGKNDVGQVGDVTKVNRSAPVQIASLTGQIFDNVSSPTQIGSSSWTQVAAGDLFTTAVRYLDGGLFTWGYGINGRLGSGATASRSSPVQVGTSSWIAISTGGTENTVGLTTAYTLFSWGKNNFGQVGDASTTDRLAPTAVGAALNTNLMTDIIKTVTQVGASSWTQVSAGDSHVYAIKAVDNGLFTWGKNDQGQLGQSIATTIHRSSPVQVSAGSQYTIISAGYSYGAAVTILGTLFTTGLNDKGQQGAATVIGRSAFTAVGASVWSQISAGASTMIGVTTSNVVFVWGGNTSGQLGLGDTANRSSPVQLGTNLAASMYQTVYPIPTIVNTATTASWTQIGIGNEFSVGIENSGRLYAWGRNNTGQLGNGTVVDTTPTKSSPTQLATTASSFTFINTSSPVQVGTDSWNAVSSGGTHTVAIRSDGTLWAWGRNNFGQVGTLSTLDQYIPKQIDILNSYTSVAAGSDFSVAINSDYSLWRWGFNTSTDLASPHRSNPLQLGNIQYNKISAGGATALAITTGGLLYGWGRITTDDNFSYNLNIDPITWGVGFSYRDINAGDSFIHAVRTDYSLWAYGLNASGQLGINNTITRSSPVQLGTNYSWSIIGNGISSTPISAGALFLAGANTSGQLGVNDTTNKSSPVMLPANPQSTFAYPVRIGTNRFIQISAGNSHSMAIRDDYGLFAWGYNFNGQLGNSTNANTSSPVQISAGISWIQVSAGREHTAAIRLDNTLWTWGLNTRGQIGDSTTTNRLAPVQIAGYWNNVIAGASHTAAIADNNTLYIWGDDNFGQ